MGEKKKMVSSLAVFDTVAACNKGARIELFTPDGKGSGVFINVLGFDSDEYKRHEREQRDAVNRKIVQARKRGGGIDLDSAEVAEENTVALLARLTTGWENMPSPDGKGLLDFTPENCRMVYIKYPAIRRQVDEAIGDLQNFIQS